MLIGQTELAVSTIVDNDRVTLYLDSEGPQTIFSFPGVCMYICTPLCNVAQNLYRHTEDFSIHLNFESSQNTVVHMHVISGKCKFS